MKQPIQRLHSTSQWEEKFGYCRVVKAGNLAFVAGTTSTDPATGAVVYAGDVLGQARQAFSNALAALARVGGSSAHVVRTTIYVTDIGRFADVAVAHKEAFGKYPPASALLEVSRLAHPDLMIEVELTAVLD